MSLHYRIQCCSNLDRLEFSEVPYLFSFLIPTKRSMFLEFDLRFIPFKLLSHGFGIRV